MIIFFQGNWYFFKLFVNGWCLYCFRSFRVL